MPNLRACFHFGSERTSSQQLLLSAEPLLYCAPFFSFYTSLSQALPKLYYNFLDHCTFETPSLYSLRTFLLFNLPGTVWAHSPYWSIQFLTSRGLLFHRLVLKNAAPYHAAIVSFISIAMLADYFQCLPVNLGMCSRLASSTRKVWDILVSSLAFIDYSVFVWRLVSVLVTYLQTL